MAVRRPSARAEIAKIERRLARRYSFGDGWPGGEWPLRGSFRPPPFEIVAGAILTQNTNWNNVETALRGLVARGLFSAEAILRAPEARLEAAIRPSGFYLQKARRLRAISRFILDHGADFYRRVEREELLGMNGVGPETADSILLYACRRLHFVVDAYTRRVFSRYGLLAPRAPYAEIQRAFEAALPPDAGVYKRFHALIVEHAKQTCRTRPLCEGCVLVRSCARVGL